MHAQDKQAAACIGDRGALPAASEVFAFRASDAIVDAASQTVDLDRVRRC